MKRRTRLTAVPLGLGIAVIAAAAVVAARVEDPRLTQCGAGDPDNKVLASFDLARSRDIFDRFPSATRDAPELDTDTPVFVVVFDGPVTVVGTGKDGFGAQKLNNVVCVLKPPTEFFPDGETLVYYEVPLLGFHP